jgi:excisionase family DNA binding protein
MNREVDAAHPGDAFQTSRQSPKMLTVVEAAELLGIGRTLAYELIRLGEWPTPILRAGRLIKVPSGPVHELLATGRTSAEVVVEPGSGRERG